MSVSDYNTIHRTPLNQLQHVPLDLLCTYLMQCPHASRRALERVIKINQGAE